MGDRTATVGPEGDAGPEEPEAPARSPSNSRPTWASWKARRTAAWSTARGRPPSPFVAFPVFGPERDEDGEGEERGEGPWGFAPRALRARRAWARLTQLTMG